MDGTSFCRESYALQLMELFPQKFDLLRIPSRNYFEGRHKGAATSGEVFPGGFTFLEDK